MSRVLQDQRFQPHRTPKWSASFTNKKPQEAICRGVAVAMIYKRLYAEIQANMWLFRMWIQN